MKLADLATCPVCGGKIKRETVKFRRLNVRDEDLKLGEVESEPSDNLCSNVDNIFAKGYCEVCNKKVDLMYVINVSTRVCYTAESRDKLVTIKVKDE